MIEEFNKSKGEMKMENRELEDLLIRLSNVSRDMTKSVNGRGSITKKQEKEQAIVVKKLSEKLDLDAEDLNE
ncbi:hypothetical protein, partial [Mycobacterium marinum]|uniref:hypothetical protein n=1 Tax=Mycobacterium marinum TaxID=1781 RepID=UPI003567EEA5